MESRASGDPGLESVTPSTVKQPCHAEEVPVMFSPCVDEQRTQRARRGLVPTPDAVIFAELLSPPLERASLLPSLASLDVLFSRPPSRSMAVPLPDSLKGERSFALSLSLACLALAACYPKTAGYTHLLLSAAPQRLCGLRKVATRVIITRT